MFDVVCISFRLIVEARMTRKFRPWTPDQNYLFPPSPHDWLPQNHLVYFLLEVSAQIDIQPIVDDYDSTQGGQPPFHPRMMLVLLLYSYCVGVFSSRKIMARCETDVAFRVVVGEDVPGFQRISEFRRRHLQHMNRCSSRCWRCVVRRGCCKSDGWHSTARR